MKPTELTNWHKSSYSSSEHNCVELAQTDGLTGIRDSKNAAGPVLTFGHLEATTFLSAVKSGRFDG